MLHQTPVELQCALRLAEAVVAQSPDVRRACCRCRRCDCWSAGLVEPVQHSCMLMLPKSPGRTPSGAQAVLSHLLWSGRQYARVQLLWRLTLRARVCTTPCHAKLPPILVPMHCVLQFECVAMFMCACLHASMILLMHSKE